MENVPLGSIGSIVGGFSGLFQGKPDTAGLVQGGASLLGLALAPVTGGASIGIANAVGKMAGGMIKKNDAMDQAERQRQKFELASMMKREQQNQAALDQARGGLKQQMDFSALKSLSS